MQIFEPVFNGRVQQLAIYALLALLSNLALAQSDSHEYHGFSDSEAIMEMKPGWADKNVQYDEKIGKADLVISLGQQTYPALHQLVEDYAKKKGLNIVIQEGTCGATARKLADKKINVGTYCCPPGKTDRLPGLKFHTIGIGPFALVTNTKNPIKNVSTEEARNIFSGEKVYWSEVPGLEKINFSDNPIEPVVRLHCKKRPGHWRLLLSNPDLFSPRAHSVGVIPDMIKRVAEVESAIGYETLFMFKVHNKSGKVNVLTIDGHHPAELDHVKQGKYPFYRTYSLTTWDNDGDKLAIANELIDTIKLYIEQNSEDLSIVPASELRKYGWKFKGDELIGEPDGKTVTSQHNL